MGSKQYKHEWYTKNRERIINNRLKAVYGLTLLEYKYMNAIQAGVCAICKYPETSNHSVMKTPMPLAVDHDHNTGDIRGLLCQTCNQTLGRFKEDPSRFERAAEYIRNGGWKHPVYGKHKL